MIYSSNHKEDNMKYEVKKLEQSAVAISMKLEGSEFLPIRDKVVAKIGKEVEIKGFRKGHAPADAVLAQYKDAVMDEVTQEVVNSNMETIIREKEIAPISTIKNPKVTMKDSSFEMDFEIDVYPEIKLGEYKGISAEKESFEFKEEMLTQRMENMRNSKAKLVDCPEDHKAEMGDTVNLAFEGFIDGVPFEGGKSDSHQLKLGSKSFIDTFEEQLVGYVKGQEGEVKVNFPEEYHAAELAGKPAVFKVKINAIQVMETPEMNDELAKELGFESLEDLKTKTTENIIAEGTQRAEDEYLGKLILKVVEASEFEVPVSMIQQEIQNEMRRFEQQLQQQGLSLDMYMQMMGGDKKAFEEQIKPMVEPRIKSDLVLAEIARNEKIEATEEDITEKMAEVAKMYGMEVAKMEEELKTHNQLDAFKYSVKAEIVMKKTIDFIKAEAK